MRFFRRKSEAKVGDELVEAVVAGIERGRESILKGLQKSHPDVFAAFQIASTTNYMKELYLALQKISDYWKMLLRVPRAQWSKEHLTFMFHFEMFREDTVMEAIARIVGKDTGWSVSSMDVIDRVGEECRRLGWDKRTILFEDPPSPSLWDAAVMNTVMSYYQEAGVNPSEGAL